MAPIDPLQLLNALGNLLSSTGGIKSIDNVHKIASLMKKFSKKLVSRCVYCSVLKETHPDVLTAFLDQEGWFTVNLWLVDAKETDDTPFLIEMLELCRVLPMTVDRLKENNTAKIAKSLCKSPNETVRKLAVEIVTKWMKLIKGASAAAEKPAVVEKIKKKKKKEKPVKDGKLEKDINNFKILNHKKDSEEDKHDLKNNEIGKKSDDDDDDDDDTDKEAETVENALKVKEPRPKTVKTFQTKFRSTGLIEETPLPKTVIKKSGIVDRTAVAAAKNAVKRNNTSLPSFPEKKIKPSSLITPADQVNSGPGIKLIPPKPKPVHILHESAGFMDALVAVPAVPVRKRRKSQSKGGTPTSPTTPPGTTPPKLQFYKDTLEMNDNESTESSQGSEESQKKEAKEGDEESMETDQEDKKDGEEKMDTTEESEAEPGSEEKKGLRSILSQVKKRDKKKSVKWAEESNLKEFFYFDLDETERVNVNSLKNFVDMKSLEMKREREVFEHSKRLMKGDKMMEMTPWSRLHRIDLPPPIVDPGSNSTEKAVQLVHQTTTLQEIYFSRDMIPDTPHEPETEQHNPQEPQIIPLEDMSNPGQVVDYSAMDLPAPKAALPPVLTNLMMAITGQSGFPNSLDDVPQEMLHQLPPPNHQNEMPMQMGMDHHPPLGILGPPSEQYDMPPNQDQFLGPPPNNAEGWGEWRGPDGAGPPMMDNFFPQQDMNNIQRMGPPKMGMVPGMRNPMQPRFMRPGMDIRPPPLGLPMRHMGPMRGRNPRNPCRHFMMGGCRFGNSCNFLHPGINGPML